MIMPETSYIPRIMIAAPTSGSGKTTVTCALLAALKAVGIKPAAFKCGPDYIDPMMHRSVLGIPTGNLDSYFADADMLRYQLALAGAASDVSVIEGVMGYFDGLGGITQAASSAEIAHITGTPVILVVDCKKMSLSAAALIKGFADMDDPCMVGGFILNRITKNRYEALAPVIEEKTGIKALGYLPQIADAEFPSRHLGLYMPQDIPGIKDLFGRLAGQAAKSLDIDGLFAMAGRADPLVYECPVTGPICGARIAAARDEAFNFYYEENLALLKALGAQVVFFSPLRDEGLPEGAQGIIFGGGYPELYAQKLSANGKMLADVRRAIDSGMPCIAECGGFMYLHERLEDESGNVYPMCGAVQGTAYRTDKLSHFGYVQITANEDTMIADRGESLRAHEFHYWHSTCEGSAFTAKKPVGDASWQCIVSRGNLVAGFPHIYYPGNLKAVERFLKACEGYGKRA